VRTPDGPVLLTGDVCHTRWGWDNGVEPGTFLAEREPSLDSLNKLRALSNRHTDIVGSGSATKPKDYRVR